MNYHSTSMQELMLSQPDLIPDILKLVKNDNLQDILESKATELINFRNYKTESSNACYDQAIYCTRQMMKFGGILGLIIYATVNNMSIEDAIIDLEKYESEKESNIELPIEIKLDFMISHITNKKQCYKLSQFFKTNVCDSGKIQIDINHIVDIIMTTMTNTALTVESEKKELLEMSEQVRNYFKKKSLYFCVPYDILDVNDLDTKHDIVHDLQSTI